MSDAARMATDVPALPDERQPFVYRWPNSSDFDGPAWSAIDDGRLLTRAMPETAAELAQDSRWPALFPSAICIVTASDGQTTVLEKVVGASIVNRFPYTLALSFCRQPLSDRHYVRSTTMDTIEATGRVAVQFLRPGPALAQAMSAITKFPEDAMAERLRHAGPASCVGSVSKAPILDGAYLVYEGSLVRPGNDFEGNAVNAQPFIDCGSHRIYNFEIDAISLADEVASADRPVQWRSLPVWRGVAPTADDSEHAREDREQRLSRAKYVKSYRPDYVFPSPETIAFAGTPNNKGFSELNFEPFVQSQAEVDNDQARWPCFFPIFAWVDYDDWARWSAGSFPLRVNLHRISSTSDRRRLRLLCPHQCTLRPPRLAGVASLGGSFRLRCTALPRRRAQGCGLSREPLAKR